MILTGLIAMRAMRLFRAVPVGEPLLERLAAGEPNALGEVYDQHHVSVRAFALRLLGDAASAEDLVHEVFVDLPKRVSRYQGHSSLRSFLLGVTANYARHHVRSAARRRAAIERMGQSIPSQAMGSPEAEVREASFLSDVQAALQTLPLAQRVAFVLCDVEERSSQEAAEIAGVPAATMRTRLHHARRKLREALAEHEVEGDR